MLKKTLIICAHLGLLGWIVSTAFRTNDLSNETLLTNYAAIAVFGFFLFRTKSTGNA